MTGGKKRRSLSMAGNYISCKDPRATSGYVSASSDNIVQWNSEYKLPTLDNGNTEHS